MAWCPVGAWSYLHGSSPCVRKQIKDVIASQAELGQTQQIVFEMEKTINHCFHLSISPSFLCSVLRTNTCSGPVKTAKAEEILRHKFPRVPLTRPWETRLGNGSSAPGQGLSISALWASGAGWLSEVGHSGHCRVTNSISGVHPPCSRSTPSPDMTTPVIPTHRQVSPGAWDHPLSVVSSPEPDIRNHSRMISNAAYASARFWFSRPGLLT